MAQRFNHYDAAFEEFLRHVRVPYVPVDESRRALLAEASLKSMDFIVYSPRGQNLLVDVKGRRFPSGASSGHKWENWATVEDLSSLLAWEGIFGTGFRAVLVFAYDVAEPRWLREFERLFRFRNRTYAFYGIWADRYRDAMRTRSRSWETVGLPSHVFRSLRHPFHELL